MVGKLVGTSYGDSATLRARLLRSADFVTHATPAQLSCFAVDLRGCGFDFGAGRAKRGGRHSLAPATLRGRREEQPS